MPEGGLIILGLDEHNDFIPVGLSDVATLEQGVAGQAREAVTPPLPVRSARTALTAPTSSSSRWRVFRS